MSKKNKRGILNQIVDEPVEETKEEVIESEPMVIDPEVFETKLFVEEEPEVEELVAPEEVAAQEEPFVGEVSEEKPKEVHFDFKDNYFFGTPSETADKQTEIDMLPVEEPVRTLESLSKSELRDFQRTGKMPK